MRTKKKELDVDFIGGLTPLTKDEERRISEVIKKLKAKKKLTFQSKKRKSPPKKNVTA